MNDDEQATTTAERKKRHEHVEYLAKVMAEGRMIGADWVTIAGRIVDTDLPGMGFVQRPVAPTRKQVGALVAEQQACGHCDGTCGSCLEDADQIIELFRSGPS